MPQSTVRSLTEVLEGEASAGGSVMRRVLYHYVPALKARQLTGFRGEGYKRFVMPDDATVGGGWDGWGWRGGVSGGGGRVE